MKLCRYIVAPVSPWGTRLRSDTLYGLICLYVAEMEGDVACREIIEAFEANRAPFRISSASPAGFLPMPTLPPIKRERFRELAAETGGDPGDDLTLFEALQKFKKFRKKSWLSVETWKKARMELSAERLFKEDDASPKLPTEKQAYEPHVAINRATGQAMDGQLFFRRLNYMEENARLHLYARTDDPAWLLKYLQIIGVAGFGRDASVGNGQFEINIDDDFNGEGFDGEGDARLLLSVCAAPDERDLSGFYKLETKRGKTGPGRANPFKKPFLMATEGSVLLKEQAGPFVLRGLNADPAIAQILEPLVLPCRLDDGKGMER